MEAGQPSSILTSMLARKATQRGPRAADNLVPAGVAVASAPPQAAEEAHPHLQAPIRTGETVDLTYR